MQARNRKGAAGLHLAGDVGVVERTPRLQGDIGRLRIALVSILERRLHLAQRSGIHDQYPFSGGRMTDDRGRKKASIFRLLSSVVRCLSFCHHHIPPPAAARVSPSSVTATRSSERSSAASTRRLTKSKAADWRSRGRGRSQPISS